ncbi:hypothetical protein GCM10023091_29190 [Ravibacter arvi]|uniref:Uncharacterized protein n=1 Tax=Ravibacter arvi TaxID=2051041 RepID=A0ABP8M358_9BACT
MLYHGRERWRYRTLASLFKELNEDLLLFIPDYEYIYHDLGYTESDLETAIINKIEHLFAGNGKGVLIRRPPSKVFVG